MDNVIEITVNVVGGPKGDKGDAGDGIVNGVLDAAQITSPLVTTHVPTGTTQAINWEDGEAQTVDLGAATGNVTLTLSNPVVNSTAVLKIIQGATPRNLIMPSNVKTFGGFAIANTFEITGADNAIDLITFFFDGVDYIASIGQDAKLTA